MTQLQACVPITQLRLSLGFPEIDYLTSAQKDVDKNLSFYSLR